MTYTTINEAFKNGTGDVCFEKNNEYLFISRKSSIEVFEKLKNDGFRHVKYSEVLRIGREELKNK